VPARPNTPELLILVSAAAGARRRGACSSGGSREPSDPQRHQRTPWPASKQHLGDPRSTSDNDSPRTHHQLDHHPRGAARRTPRSSSTVGQPGASTRWPGPSPGLLAASWAGGGRDPSSCGTSASRTRGTHRGEGPRAGPSRRRRRPPTRAREDAARPSAREACHRRPPDQAPRKSQAAARSGQTPEKQVAQSEGVEIVWGLLQEALPSRPLRGLFGGGQVLRDKDKLRRRCAQLARSHHPGRPLPRPCAPLAGVLAGPSASCPP